MISGRLATLALDALLSLVLGCAHGDGATRNEPKSATEQGAKAKARPAKATATTSAEHPPLAGSPADVLEPGAREKIAQALTDKGFLTSDTPKEGALTTALRKFQESQGLAATGFPDQETVRRLGIDPKTVKPSGEPPGSGQGGSGHSTPPPDDSSKGASE